MPKSLLKRLYNGELYPAEYIESIEHFTYGFRLGVCLMIEIFTAPGEYCEE